MASQQQAPEVLAEIVGGAKPFVDTVKSTSLDLELVKHELERVWIPSLLREQICKPLARTLGVKVDDLRDISPPSEKAHDFEDPEPWPQPVAGDLLLHDIAALAARHIVAEDHCQVAFAPWTVVCFLVDYVDIMPLLAITSPEKRCGKSRLLTLLLKLVRRPLPAVALTPATIFRSIEKWQPTLLIDEADGLLKDSRGNDNLELRSIINASHTKDFAYVPRCIEKTHEVKKFSTWAPKAIALIGRMPDSMMDRSIQIPLDRAEDCWLPMLAIAEVAGGDWPLLARKAAVALSADTDDADTFATKLLRALKQDFIDQDETDADGFQLTTDICDHLNKDKEAPWADFKNGMTPEILARNLGRHKVKSDRVMHEGNRVRGFYWQKLKPIFDRYL